MSKIDLKLISSMYYFTQSFKTNVAVIWSQTYTTDHHKTKEGSSFPILETQWQKSNLFGCYFTNETIKKFIKSFGLDKVSITALAQLILAVSECPVHKQRNTSQDVLAT